MHSKTADFALVPPPGKLHEMYMSPLILACSIHISHCRQQSQATNTEDLVEFGPVDLRGQTNKQTHRQTDELTAILRNPTGGVP